VLLQCHNSGSIQALSGGGGKEGLIDLTDDGFWVLIAKVLWTGVLLAK
jgi:hypothetical protein